MSLLFCDSFDHYSTLSQKWSGTYFIVPTIVSGQGRNGTSAAQWLVNGSMFQNLPTTLATVIVGFAVNFNMSNLGIDCRLLTFLDSSVDQLYIIVFGDGSIKAYRGSLGITNFLGSSAPGVVTSGYHYVEVEATIDPSAGVINVRLDGNSVLNLTGQNTRASANSYCTQVAIGAATPSQTLSNAINPVGYIDDVYLLNTSGSVNNAFLGDTKVQCVMPTANGSTNQWAIGGSAPAATNWQSVNEIPPNDGVTFVDDATVSQEDLYTFAAVSSPNVHAVVVNLRASKDDATSRAIRAIAYKSPTTIDNGTDFFVTQTTYTDFQGIFETDTGGSQWTAANVNASQFGEKVTV